MNRYLAIIILTTIFALIYSCKENEGLLTDPNNVVPSESVLIPLSPINSQIILNISEDISTSNSNVVLSCYTRNLYSPAGSKILSDFSLVNNSIQIEFKELKMSEMGAGISAPASVKFNLGSLPNGYYSLNITINGKKVIGLITINDESFELKIQPNNLISIYQEKLLRIPSSIIWGQSESIEQTPFQLFIDSLIVLGAKPHNLNAGDYSYFEVDTQGGFNTHSALGMPYGKYFLYNYEGDSTSIRNLIKRFAKRYLDSIYIQLSGGKGEMYYSTVLRNEP